MSWEYVKGVPTFAPCVYYTPSGKRQKGSTKYNKIVSVQDAIALLAQGNPAHVRPEEADQVDAWLYART